MNARLGHHLPVEQGDAVDVVGAQAGEHAVQSLHYVWESWFGTIVIEVVDGIVYVNGERVARDTQSS